MDLLQLQNLCKRDHGSYKEEFLLQQRHFLSELQLFKIKPSSQSETFESLIAFLSAVAPFYKKELAEFPKQLMELIENNFSVINPDTRRIIIQALMLMRNRDFIPPTTLLPLFFKLFKCKDKILRTLLHKHIVSDVKNINKKHRNDRVNKSLQNYMYTVLQDPDEIASKKALDVIIELYQRKIWHDSKTVNVIGTAVFTSNTKMRVAALKFLVNSSSESDVYDEETQAKEEKKSKYMNSQNIIREFAAIHSKKTRARKRRLSKELKKVVKTNKESLDNKEEDYTDASTHIPLYWLTDPQGFCDRLFGMIKNSNDRFEVKILMMSVLSRCIAFHKCLVENYYSFLMKYIEPHQQHITLILALTAQAVHDLVPPESLYPLVVALADKFVEEYRGNDVIAIGLNTIREICVRQPLVMDKGLLARLIQFKKYKDKGVMAASRSVLQLYRTINPSLLAGKERGKGADVSIKPRQYGEIVVAQSVPGAELLLDEEKNESENEDSDEDSDEENEDEDSDDDGKEKTTGKRKKGEDDDDDDDEEKEDETEEKTKPETKKRRVDLERILTENDFAKIERKRNRLRDQLSDDEDTPGSKYYSSSVSQFIENDNVVDPSDIEVYSKKKMNKEERMAWSKRDRDGDEKFGVPKEKMGGSSTNKEKVRNKPFMLSKQSRAVRDKLQMSCRQRQAIKNKRHKFKKAHRKRGRRG